MRHLVQYKLIQEGHHGHAHGHTHGHSHKHSHDHNHASSHSHNHGHSHNIHSNSKSRASTHDHHSHGHSHNHVDKQSKPHAPATLHDHKPESNGSKAIQTHIQSSAHPRPHFAGDNSQPASLRIDDDEDDESQVVPSSGPLTPINMGSTFTSMENLSVPNFQGTSTPTPLHINQEQITGAAEFNQSIIHIAQELEGHHGHDHHDHGSMNMHGIFLHLVGDALGSLGVIVTALVSWLTEWKYKWLVDPLLRYLIIPLYQDSRMILNSL